MNSFDPQEVPGDPVMRPPPGFWSEYERLTSGTMGDRDDFVGNCLEAARMAKERPRLQQAARVLRGVIEEYGEELRPALMALLEEDVAKIAAAVAAKVVDRYEQARRERLKLYRPGGE